MKIGIDEIRQGIHSAAIDKITQQLKKEGYNVIKDFHYNHTNSNGIRFDLWAEKGDDKRIYEFKIGKNRIYKNQFERLQAYAKELKAKLFIIYLEVPKSKEIEVDGLDSIILSDLIDNTPSELESLATCVRIDEVENLDITSICITNSYVKLVGTGTILVLAQFGSDRDLNRDDGFEQELSFDFYFKMTYDILNDKVIDSYYKIDTEWYYE